MRTLLAASVFAIGSSFVLVTLKDGDQALAAAIAMAACSTAALMIGLLGHGEAVVDHLDHAGHPARGGGRVLGVVSRVREDTH